MIEVHLPDLTFPNLSYGPNEVPWDLKPWLYKGGAQIKVLEVSEMIESGQLGRPLVERIELVRQIHEVLLNRLESGGRRESAKSSVDMLRLFFLWADRTEGPPLSLASVEQIYRHWCDSLLHRVRVGSGLKERSAYTYGSRVGEVLDRVLGRSKPIAKSTRLRMPKTSLRAVSPAADKQNLEETFAFGHFLLDLVDALDVSAIFGTLPLYIPLRNGKTLIVFSGLRGFEKSKSWDTDLNSASISAAKRARKNRANWEADKSYRTRYPLINLRILAEMFMLMGQPAVNFAQAYQLRMDQWRYKPSSQGYEIRTYKHRRWGPVVFEIYSEYRKVFERYLQWRKAIFPNDPDGLLFPLLGTGGTQPRRRTDRAPTFSALEIACKRAGVIFQSPRVLRNTNVNWMLRRTQDPDLTAAEKQHAKQTLLRVYDRPSLQRAMVQTQVFWAKYDPALASAGPGKCAGKVPEPVADIPATVTRPDCKKPAGCLFCAQRRDIDSLDHVWSLVSYRLLKSFELPVEARAGTKKELFEHPAEAVIERISAILTFIETSSPTRAKWVSEALLRLEEARYHPAWAGLIESL